ncbi:MAG TPA: TonB-dependent receptor [Hyphomicrobium sp.]|nr:TonB-dependent receptor [Hyphomicrobium sp.]
MAQESENTAAPTPAPSELPPVDVVQQKAAPSKQAKKKSPPKKQAVAPTPQPPAEVAAPAQAPGTGGIASGSVNMSPVAGSDLPIEYVPTAVGRASSEDFTRTRETNIQQTLQATVPGVFMNDSQGNVFQGGVQYRGFESSPINGAPQGIAVYQNGTRINEVFGDVVNWDFIPAIAVDSITVLGANPVYGLNAIGGAIGITMRDGFNFQGVELDTRFGSFGRVQGSAAVGMQSGNWGIFAAFEGIKDDGYRDFGDSEVKRMYADLGFRTSDAEFHLSFTGARNEVGVTAAAPDVILDLDWGNTFTSPQINENEMGMVQLSGTVKATDRLTLAGQMYYRTFKQNKVDGNILDVTDPNDCDGDPNEICVEEGDEYEELTYRRADNGRQGSIKITGTTLDGVPLLNQAMADNRFGVIDQVNQDNQSFGGSVQAVDRSKLFGFWNQFLVGASYDHGEVSYNTQSQLGVFGPKFVVNGLRWGAPLNNPARWTEGAPVILDGEDFFPRDVDTRSDYVGLYFTNTTVLSQGLALTLGGRWNYAHLDLKLNSEPAPGGDGDFEDKMTGSHTYTRFNPTVGLTYQLARGLTAFGGYSEANRAPTAAELSCADPEAPCLIESLLVADPPLEQVVSKTFELGLRGTMVSWGRDEALSWSVSGFHTRNEDDIISINAEQFGRGYFDNVGETKRVGVEAAIQYQTKWLYAYAGYSYVQATFEESLEISAPDNPLHEDCSGGEGECVFVSPGNRMPGIPEHRLKAGFNYYITPKWAFGVDMIAASNQVFFGDEGNDNKRLPGFAKFNLHTSYNVNDNVQIYGLVDNVFDTRYGLFGTYYSTEGAEYASISYDPDIFENDSTARTKVPAPPVAAYGGVKVRF